MDKPSRLPLNPRFSSGPCAKRPGWRLDALDTEALGRSHRAAIGKARLGEVITRSRQILGIPASYRIGIVPASDTGAVEMALWSLLGPRGVDMLAWESFGELWVSDVQQQLRLPDLRVFRAPYGEIADLRAVSADRDVVFTWNGTTSGVRVPDAAWLGTDRAGLAICDATSAAFAMHLPWPQLDVVTWSWQKVLGGEGAHGMIVLSPRAAARLEQYVPPWPMPKVFRMTAGGKLLEGIFSGDTINTPSMLAVQDALDGLRWAESIGGLDALIARCQANFETVAAWVNERPWIGFLAHDPATRSPTSVCLTYRDPWFCALDPTAQATVAKRVVTLLEGEGAALDVGSYRDAPPGLRIWCGATVEQADLQALLPWIDWAWASVAGRSV